MITNTFHTPRHGRSVRYGPVRIPFVKGLVLKWKSCVRTQLLCLLKGQGKGFRIPFLSDSRQESMAAATSSPTGSRCGLPRCSELLGDSPIEMVSIPSIEGVQDGYVTIRSRRALNAQMPRGKSVNFVVSGIAVQRRKLCGNCQHFMIRLRGDSVGNQCHSLLWCGHGFVGSSQQGEIFFARAMCMVQVFSGGRSRSEESCMTEMRRRENRTVVVSTSPISCRKKKKREEVRPHNNHVVACSGGHLSQSS